MAPIFPPIASLPNPIAQSAKDWRFEAQFVLALQQESIVFILGIILLQLGISERVLLCFFVEAKVKVVRKHESTTRRLVKVAIAYCGYLQING